jgi:DNA mismatch repair ATPase MutS
MSGFANMAKTAREEEKHALDQAVCRALDTAFSRTIRSWEPVIERYYHDETAFFVDLLDDFRFLSAAVHFLLELRALGGKLCRPQIRPVEEKTLRLKNVYNPMLLLKTDGQEGIIANDFCYDEKGRFYLVTGPNHGGKSIFCYSLGMAQALFQLGLLVPAEEAVMSPVTAIYTHFPASDEDNYGKGRLESECVRMGEIMHKIKSTDLLLMDESFSSTSLLEGSYIAGEILRAISVIGCGGLYVTHIHALTQQVAQFNETEGRTGCIDNLVAQMENIADGTRSYRVLRTTPDGLSYAKDIASKYGLSCDEILHREPTNK